MVKRDKKEEWEHIYNNLACGHKFKMAVDISVGGEYGNVSSQVRCPKRGIFLPTWSE